MENTKETTKRNRNASNRELKDDSKIIILHRDGGRSLGRIARKSSVIEKEIKVPIIKKKNV